MVINNNDKAKKPTLGSHSISVNYCNISDEEARKEWHASLVYKVTKKTKTSAYRDGTHKNQPSYMKMTPQYFHTILTSCMLKLCISTSSAEFVQHAGVLIML